jgi:hypothetical protein
MEDQKAKELQEKVEELKKNMHSDFDKLFEKISGPEYDGRGYKKDAKVSMSGEVFTLFINVNAENKRVMDAVQKNLVVAFNTIDALLTENAKLSIELMKAHIANIDAGVTTPNSELIEKTQEKDGKEEN